MSTTMTRRFFVRKSTVATAAVVAAVAGACASVKLAENGPRLATNTAEARMGFNPRVCCPHYNQDDNPNHVCDWFCRIG